MPEDRALSQETRTCIDRAIEALPPNQRVIITLRDIEGWGSEETCTFLGISEVNQRVLLHRARSKVRGALEKYFEEEKAEDDKRRCAYLQRGRRVGYRVYGA